MPDDIARQRHVATTVSQARSALMSRIGTRDTKPELIVRRVLHGLGYRFRLQAAELPGRPDIVLRPRRKAIFVHGCFWHRHACRKASMPKSNTEFWRAKFLRNVERDAAAVAALEANGWGVLVIWECETTDVSSVAERLGVFLGRLSVRTST